MTNRVCAHGIQRHREIAMSTDRRVREAVFNNAPLGVKSQELFPNVYETLRGHTITVCMQKSVRRVSAQLHPAAKRGGLYGNPYRKMETGFDSQLKSVLQWEASRGLHAGTVKSYLGMAHAMSHRTSDIWPMGYLAMVFRLCQRLDGSKQ